MKTFRTYLFIVICLNLLLIEQVRADDTNTSNVPESTNNAERLIMPQEEQQEKDFSTQIPKLEQNTNKIQQSQQNINEQSQEQQYDDNQFKGLAPD